MKICSYCGEEKPLSDFYTKPYVRRDCKVCTKIIKQFCREPIESFFVDYRRLKIEMAIMMEEIIAELSAEKGRLRR